LPHVYGEGADLSASVEPTSWLQHTAHISSDNAKKLFRISHLSNLTKSERGRRSNIAFIINILHMCCQKNGIVVLYFLSEETSSAQKGKKEPNHQTKF